MVLALRSELDIFEDALLELEGQVAEAYEELEKELDLYDEQVMYCLRDQVEVWGDIPEAAHDINKDVDLLVAQLRKDKEEAAATARAARTELRKLEARILEAEAEAKEAQ